MKGLSAALALAAVAVLSASAAAQSDASFAAALSAPPSGLAIMAQLKTEPQKPAAAPALGEPVPAAVWMKIINFLRNKGTWEPREEGSDYETYSILQKAQEPMTEFSLMGIDMLAEPVTSPSMKIAAVRFAAIKITGSGPKKRVQSWSYTTDYAGRLKFAVMGTMTMDSTGASTDETNMDLNVADPLVAADYAKIIKYWTE